MSTQASTGPYPWVALISRTVFFLVMQVGIALILLASGSRNAFGEAARWWVFSAIGANIASVLLLQRLYRLEGRAFREVFVFVRSSFWKDLGLSLGAFVLAGPIAILPMRALGSALFGSYDSAVELLFRPIPSWAIAVGVLFPVTLALAELPTYFAYAMPRLESRGMNRWAAWLVASLFLSLQHLTLPLILDWRYVAWRSVMFLPFALFVGIVIRLRPRLLPFLLVGHCLIDLATLSVYLMP